MTTAYDPSTCVRCGKPAVWWSPTGHGLCEHDHELYEELRVDEHPHGNDPVDLRQLLSGEAPTAEWFIEPLLPAGKLVAVVSKRGEGKSLLMLDLVANVCTGQVSLHQPAGEPRSVVYLDMEMGPDDLYERLTDLGYGPTHPDFDKLCQNLHYYLLPSLPALDTPEGGEALEEIVERHQAALVVIDTVSRVVGGDENAAEPYRELYRNTEVRLKRRRVTLARLDHLGKDPGRGSRGSSAKEDPMDVVWQMTTTAATGAIVFSLTKGRQGWLPPSVTIHRRELHDGTIKHVVFTEPPPDWLEPLIASIDRLGIDPELSVNKTFNALKEAKLGAMRSRVSTAVRVRRARFETRKSGTQKVSTTLFGENENQYQYQSVPPTDIASTTSSTTSVPPVLAGYPPKRGYQRDGDPENDIFDLAEDFEPEPGDLPEME